VAGALVFGRLSDRLGRKKLFVWTLGLYLVANGIAAAAWNTWWLDAFRILAGMGIDGEYAAINSAIDELIPSRHRGRVDIWVNGTYWAGATIATLAGTVLLNASDVGINLGWRLALLIGPALGVVVWFVRRTLPESPRWLITHGRAEEAERNIAEIEAKVRASGHELTEVAPDRAIDIDTSRQRASLLTVARVLFRDYPKRSLLGAALMITQSFLYNAIFFTYAQVLATFFVVKDTSLYYVAFALGNLCGPLVLGLLFDIAGRRFMISVSYLTAGVLLAQRRSFPAGPADGDHADAVLDGGLFHRLGRRVGRLPDRERDLPDGAAGPGHRRVLRHRPGLRLARADRLRQLPGVRKYDGADDRLPDRGGRDGRRRPGGADLRRGRGAQVAGGRGASAQHDSPRGRVPGGHARLRRRGRESGRLAGRVRRVCGTGRA
jgi:MFS family permease